MIIFPIKKSTNFKNNNFFLIPGNIALHIFSEKTRKIYDLETLWSVGPEYDGKTDDSTEVIDMLENYSSYLKDLKPLA